MNSPSWTLKIVPSGHMDFEYMITVSVEGIMMQMSLFSNGGMKGLKKGGVCFKWDVKALMPISTVRLLSLMRGRAGQYNQVMDVLAAVREKLRLTTMLITDH